MPATRELGQDALGRILLNRGFISAEQLEVALLKQKEVRRKLGRILLDLGFVNGRQLLAALAEQGHVEYVRTGDCLIDPRVLQAVPRKTVEPLGLLPLLRLGGVLLVAAVDGPDQEANIAAAEAALRCPVEIVLQHDPATFASCIEAAYDIRAHRRTRDARIGEFLVREGAITQDELKHALDLQKRSGLRLGDVVVGQGLLARERFHSLLAEHLGMPPCTFEHMRGALSPEVAQLVPRAFATHNRVLPFAREGDSVRVLASGPLDEWVKENVRAATKARRVEAFLAPDEDLRRAILEAYAAPAVPEADRPEEEFEARADFRAEAAPWSDVLVPRTINDLLQNALRRRASDIHIENDRERVLTRFRIDGILTPIPDAGITRENVRRVLSRLKLDCKLDIAERRRPQDGAFLRRFPDRDGEVDFRVAFQPTIRGENVIVRLLDRTRALPTLEEIGFQEATLRKYTRMVENPQGMILFTGPTGCGKTTSLYATLDVLRRRPIKIITAEDPVEYYFDGIQQCQVNDAIGNSFARFLRGFLRQDPDVILVGEMRDPETAEFGVRAALTGHLVFTTLHTNDTIGTVRRLLNMGVAPDMLAGSLLCVVSQRLVRTTCSRCSAPFVPPEALLDEFYPAGAPATAKFMFGKGCAHCGQTGYHGRMPIFEFWELDESAKDLIGRSADDAELREQAARSGMPTMVQDALLKAEKGLTTLSELLEEIPYLQLVAHRRAAKSRSSRRETVGSA